MLFIIFKGTNIHCSIWILNTASTMHIVILELTLIDGPICEVFSSTYDLVMSEYSFIDHLVLFLVWL